MIATETDAQVIAASLSRPERFEEIFDRHALAIYRYLRRRVGDQLAEELAAEAFTTAFRIRQQFHPDSASALPWLYGIAVNLVRMHLRSDQRRRRAYRLVSRNVVEPSVTAEVEARLDAAALGPVLSAVLSALPSQQREVLLLHAWAGLSPAEIAEALGISGPTARKRLHRARAMATEQLARQAQNDNPIRSQTRSTS